MKSFNHFGVYGICEDDGKLLLIHKSKGAYTGRYDLPGGRLEVNESLEDGLVREFMEETGLSVAVKINLGIFDCFVRYQENGFTHMHHLAALYTVELQDDQVSSEIGRFEEQDSLGMEWVEIAALSLESASPVVMLAVKWLNSGTLTSKAEYYNQWKKKQW